MILLLTTLPVIGVWVATMSLYLHQRRETLKLGRGLSELQTKHKELATEVTQIYLTPEDRKSLGLEPIAENIVKALEKKSPRAITSTSAPKKSTPRVNDLDNVCEDDDDHIWSSPLWEAPNMASNNIYGAEIDDYKVKKRACTFCGWSQIYVSLSPGSGTGKTWIDDGVRT